MADSAPVVVLIVDPDADARRILQCRFAHDGFRTITAPSGHVALFVAYSVRPAVVVSELYLRTGAGPCFIHAMRADPRLRHVSLVAHTVFTMPGDLAWAAAAPVDAFLRKPASPSEVAAVVRRLAQPPPSLGAAPRQ